MLSPSSPLLEDGPTTYNAILQSSRWYCWLLIASGLLSALLFPLLLFLLLRKSPPEMSQCVKKLLLNSAVTALGIALLMAIWLPVPLHPILRGFSLGILRWAGLSWNCLFVGLWLFLLQNCSLNYLFAFLHYYALLNPTWALHGRFRSVSVQFCAIYVLCLGLILSVVLGTVLTGTDSPDQLMDFARSFPYGHFVPVIVANEPSVLGDRLFSGHFWPILFFALFAAIFVFEALAIVGLNVGILVEIRRSRDHVQAKTFCLQLMAYLRLFLAKTVLLFLFLLLPVLVIVLSFLGFFSSLGPQMFCYLFFSFHSPLIMLQTILLVRPYRQWTFKMVKEVTSRIKSGLGRIGGAVRVQPVPEGAMNKGEAVEGSNARRTVEGGLTITYNPGSGT